MPPTTWFRRCCRPKGRRQAANQRQWSYYSSFQTRRENYGKVRNLPLKFIIRATFRKDFHPFLESNPIFYRFRFPLQCPSLCGSCKMPSKTDPTSVARAHISSITCSGSRAITFTFASIIKRTASGGRVGSTCFCSRFIKSTFTTPPLNANVVFNAKILVVL